MRRSRSLVPTLRENPAEATARSHQLLARAGFIRQLGAGLYTLLPLGWRTLRRIEAVVREEMSAAGAQELHMPALHPAALWRETGRWDAMGETMFRVRDRAGGEYCLGMTHEEVVTALARDTLRSHRDVPQTWFQIQAKFRDEERPRGGLLRTRQFTMKDAYSFDVDRAGLDASFEAQRRAYVRLFARCGVAAVAIDADSGAMGGDASTEFMLATDAGEDTFVRCAAACGYAANVEVARRDGGASERCPRCEAALESARGLEVGHVFKLGTRYSRAMGACVTRPDGTRVPLEMGCYGIGLERLMAAAVEACADTNGIRWPAAIAPFDLALIPLQMDAPRVVEAAETLYAQLRGAGVEVLFDDRDERAGRKLQESDLIGLPIRVVVSRDTLAKGAVEWRARDDATSSSPQSPTLVPLADLVERARASLAR